MHTHLLEWRPGWCAVGIRSSSERVKITLISDLNSLQIFGVTTKGLKEIFGFIDNVAVIVLQMKVEAPNIMPISTEVCEKFIQLP